MCMENGEWEPDPTEMNYRDNKSTYIVKSTSNAGITLMTPRIQTGTANVIAVIIIIVYVVSLIVFLAIGYILVADLVIDTIANKYVQTKQCLILLRMFAIVLMMKDLNCLKLQDLCTKNYN